MKNIEICRTFQRDQRRREKRRKDGGFGAAAFSFRIK